MKINKVNNQALLERLIRSDHKNTSQTKAVKTAPKGKVVRDTVEISGEGKIQKDMTRYVEIVKNMPDVRPEALQRARKKIETGEYNKMSVYRKTAEKILEE